MTDLITLDEYKEYKGLTSNKDDLRLQSIITSVSQLVKTYCANSFVDYVEDPKVEYISIPWNTNIIQLTESPIIEIVSVKERATYDSPYIELSSTAYQYYFDAAIDTIYRTNGGGYMNWAKGPGSVRLEYLAGYEELPKDLKLGVMDIVVYYDKEEYKERRTLGAVSISNQTTSTQWRNVDFPDHIKRILDLYKLV